MLFSKSILMAAGLIASASAHMAMSDPAPLAYKANKNTVTVDYSYTSPLSASGSDFPCKGHLNLLGTPEGVPTAEWTAGSTATFTVAPGGARHEGGSCQASISEDGGKTFKVMKTYIGNCPAASGGTFTFNVPAGAKSGTAVFAWTWFNKVGNREMYMNCAAVNIKGGTGAGISSLPDMFVANIGNGCSSNAESTGDLEIPNPGADVQRDSTKTGPPVGNCAKAAAPAPGAGDNKGVYPAPGAPSATGGAPAPAPTSSAPADGGAPAPAPTSSAPADGGAGGNVGGTPTQTYDDGKYRPKPTGAASAAPIDAPAAAPTPAPAPSDSPAAGGDQGQEYDIVMVIDGKTQTGKAYLTQPTPTPKGKFKRAVNFRA